MTEDNMVGWHHRLNGHEFEQLQKMVKDREAWRAPEKLPEVTDTSRGNPGFPAATRERTRDSAAGGCDAEPWVQA